MITLLRSWLFVPGTRPDRFERALSSGADAVVFDLEDSVKAGRKAEARTAIATFLSQRPQENDDASVSCLRFVRVNGSGTSWIADDLESVRTLHIDGIVLPKVETPEQIEAAIEISESLPVIPLLETARGILNALAIGDTLGSIPALLFGAEDLTAQLGIPRTLGGEELLFARSQVVLAAAAAGVQAIDAVFTQIAAPDDLRRDATRAKALGFSGKMAIHPDQIGVINEVFSPTTDEVDRAQRIVDASDAALAVGEGVIRLDNQMVDTPVVLRARLILALADAASRSRK